MKTRPRFFAAALGVWFVFLAVAISFGAVRELLLTPVVGDRAADVAGTLAVIAAFLGVMLVFVRRFRECFAARDLWFVGLLWLVKTASFEFLFFHFVAGKSWEDLLAEYNLANGRIWALVLLTTLFGPPVIYIVLRRSIEGARYD